MSITREAVVDHRSTTDDLRRYDAERVHDGDEDGKSREHEELHGWGVEEEAVSGGER